MPCWCCACWFLPLSRHCRARSATELIPRHPSHPPSPFNRLELTMSYRPRFKTFAVVAALAATLVLPAHAQDKLKLKIIGQPLATGPIQKNKEQPFFENFAAKTGLPIDADYKPMDTLGIKDTEQLRVMKSGLFDIVSLRVSQNSRDEPTILGLDLVGASPDYATGRKVAKAYA